MYELSYGTNDQFFPPRLLIESHLPADASSNGTHKFSGNGYVPTVPLALNLRLDTLRRIFRANDVRSTFVIRTWPFRWTRHSSVSDSSFLALIMIELSWAMKWKGTYLVTFEMLAPLQGTLIVPAGSYTCAISRLTRRISCEMSIELYREFSWEW